MSHTKNTLKKARQISEVRPAERIYEHCSDTRLHDARPMEGSRYASTGSTTVEAPLLLHLTLGPEEGIP